MRRIKTAVESVISFLRYPKFATTLINKVPVDTTFSRGGEVEIGSGCMIRGDVSIGDDVHIGPDCTLNGEIRIGTGANLNGRNVVRGNVDIGRYTAISPSAEIRSKNHSVAKPTLQLKLYRQITGKELEWDSKGDIVIGNDVWIGSQSKILSGVEIGHGAIIGAGAVVTDDVEPYAIMAGVPAEMKKWRFSADIREELLALKWWEWSKEEMRENREFFETNLHEVESVSDVLT